MSQQTKLFAIVEGTEGPQWFAEHDTAQGELDGETYILFEGPADLTRIWR